MPRPATLPVIDWKAVFDSGLDYAGWLAAAESPEQRGKMEALLAKMPVGVIIEEKTALLGAGSLALTL